LTTNIMEEIIKQGTHHPKFDFSSSYLQWQKTAVESFEWLKNVGESGI
jgi:hypothetical protein